MLSNDLCRKWDLAIETPNRILHRTGGSSARSSALLWQPWRRYTERHFGISATQILSEVKNKITKVRVSHSLSRDTPCIPLLRDIVTSFLRVWNFWLIQWRRWLADEQTGASSLLDDSDTNPPTMEGFASTEQLEKKTNSEYTWKPQIWHASFHCAARVNF